MEDISNKLELNALRLGGGSTSFKSTLSGRSTPKSSPTFKRAHSSRTPRRDARGSASGVQWFRSNRVLFWLLLITLWAYLGFFVQSRWAHANEKDNFLGGNQIDNQNEETQQSPRRDLMDAGISSMVKNLTDEDSSKVNASRRMEVVLAGKGTKQNSSPKKKKKPPRKNSKIRGLKKTTTNVVKKSIEIEDQEPDIPRTNATYGMLFGPFTSLEDRVLEWSPEKRSGTCDRKEDFARLVWSRRFLLIFHELSMTGAPLSMMELATELLSCGATVSAVVLSKRGGLMSELNRRRIKVLEDKADFSFKTAMKSDLVIAGSAVCSSWIDQYMDHYPAGASQIAWWIMENRREYFDRAKVVLNRVKMLIFISDSQMKQWLTWIEEDKIKLRSQPTLVPLSINDEMAFVAGIQSSLNTPSATTEKMMEKRLLLRDSARAEMGLTDKDVLVMSLSSINPGKGQLLFLESGRLVIEKEMLQNNSKIKNPVTSKTRRSLLARKHHLRGLSRKTNGTSSLSSNLTGGSSDSGKTQDQLVKILIGSVGSKSNKIVYVKEILEFLSQHSNLSKSVMWALSTTRVAALYSAADVYVINSQGLGETFGRVTIEAMAFGLPVLGTDAGGTKEIVEHNVTGLLHPVGRLGAPVLANNLQFFIKNPSARKEMGSKGREKVERMYLKRHMYKRFVGVITKCMRTK